MQRRITLTPVEQSTLLWAADILQSIPEDQASHFSLSGYDDVFHLNEQAENLREMVGYASGALQYDRPIGPAPLVGVITSDMMKAALVNFMESMLVIGKEYEREFIGKTTVGATINIRKPERFKS